MVSPLAASPKPIAAALASFENAKSASNAAISEDSAKAENRRAYEALSTICREYVAQFRDRNGLLRSIEHPEEAFPFEVAAIFHAMIEGWLVGEVSLSLSDLVEKPGKPGKSLYEKNGIVDACRYMQAAKKKLIADKTSVSRVSAWYGVDRSTAQSWLRASKNDDLLASFMPDVSTADRMNIIRSRAQAAGKRHAAHLEWKAKRPNQKRK